MVGRRAVVGTVLSLSLPGCAGSLIDRSPRGRGRTARDTDGDGVPDRADDFPSDDRYSRLLDSEVDRVQLASGRFKLYRFDVPAAADLYYRARTTDGSRIDIFLTDETNFHAYEERSKWSYYDGGSELNTSAAETTFTVGAERTYYLIIDNTAEGDATPSSADRNGRVTVSITAELRRRS
jgi:hypothetical protein